MRQSVLSQGDQVRYHVATTELTGLGFTLGQVYEVLKTSAGLVISTVGGSTIQLVDKSGRLTDHADYFTKKGLTTKLPRGI